MKNKINYEQIIEIASYGILIAIVVFWNFFSNLFPIKLEQVISILIGLIAATNIAWTRKFNKMEKKIDPLKTSEMLVYPDLQSAFNAILSKKKRIKTLRTYSNSSNIIQTFIRPNNIIIDHCKVMFRNLPPQEEAENKRYALELENILQRWRNLEKAGQIKKLEIVRHRYLLTEYQVIFDDDYMILGIYHPEPSDPSSVVIKSSPLVITTELKEGKKIIQTYIERFDAMFKEEGKKQCPQGASK